MVSLSFLRWIHLIAAATWLGGGIVLLALVPTLRRAGADRPMLQATAQQFARVAWTAMAVAVITGLSQVWLMRMPWTYGRLHLKLGLVALTIVATLVHQVTARHSTPAQRGVVHAFTLLANLAIFGVAVIL